MVTTRTLWSLAHVYVRSPLPAHSAIFTGLMPFLAPNQQQGIIYTPIGGGTPLLTLTHAPKLCSPIGCVYCSNGVFVHSVGF